MPAIYWWKIITFSFCTWI